jgi:signal peptidase I
MQSTLENGDRLIVVKALRTWARITRKDYQPKRGEIVVFVKNDLLIGGESGNKQLIKRVIALPGEKVTVKDGVVTVYNNERPEGFQPDKEAAYGSVIEKTGIDGTWTVGADEVFVCGDNRDNSLDSRSFGPIHEKDIVGTAKLRFLPVNQSRSL